MKLLYPSLFYSGRGFPVSRSDHDYKLLLARRQAVFKKYCKGEILISLVVFFGCIYLFYETNKFEGLEVYGKMGPSYWPRFLLFLLMLLSVFIAFTTALQVKRGTASSGFQAKFDLPTLRLFTAMALIVFYILGLKIFGFLVLTPFMMIAFMLLLGERNKFWILTISLILPISVIILFTKVMYVPLPRGAGIFLQISQLIY